MNGTLYHLFIGICIIVSCSGYELRGMQRDSLFVPGDVCREKTNTRPRQRGIARTFRRSNKKSDNQEYFLSKLVRSDEQDGLNGCRATSIKHDHIEHTLSEYSHRDKHIQHSNRKDLSTKNNNDKRELYQYIGSLFYDVLMLYKNMVTWDSFKIATMVFPFFTAARMIDEPLQSCFYDSTCHKNVCYIPKQCHDIAEWGIFVPIALLGSQAFFGKTTAMRQTSYMLLLGLPFVFWTKTFIKKIECEVGIRPWHEKFDCTKRAGGGFPSGHMAKATYMTFLYGLRFGPRFAVPLGMVTTFVGGSFVACNRHYLSQLIAGVGLGALYGFAAHKVVDSKMDECFNLVVTQHNGGPAVSVSYAF